MTLASALLWPASNFNPGHQTHSEAGPGAEALHGGGNLHHGCPDCPNTSPLALSMVPRYKPHIELGPMALMGFPPMTCGEQGGWMAALYRGTEGSPLGWWGRIIQSHAGVPLGVHSTGPHLCAAWKGPDSSSWCPWRVLGPVDRWI